MMQASAISEMRPGPKRMAVGYDQFAKGGIFFGFLYSVKFIHLL